MSSRRPIVLVAALVLLGLGVAATSERVRRVVGLVASPPRLIVLVTVDTLRADHLPFHRYPRPTAPFLSDLAERSARFDRAFSHSSHTAPSHASMLTALYPTQHGLTVNGAELDRKLPTLAGLLADAGYETAAFTSVGFLKGLKSGFDVFEHRRREEAAPGELYRPADQTVQKAIDWLDVRNPDRPLFLWVHLFDVHEWQAVAAGELDPSVAELNGPSSIHGDELIRFLIRDHGADVDALREGSPHDAARLVDAYDSQIRVVDAAIRRLYDAYGRVAIGDDALWIVTADHGEGLGSHHYAAHGRYLYDEQLHVPLLLHSTTGRIEPQVRGELVRHVDLLPTILDLIDHEAAWRSPPSADPSLLGRSLRPLLESNDAGPERRLFAERRPHDDTTLTAGWEKGDLLALQDARVKLIRHTEGEDEFFEIGVDAGERFDRFDPTDDAQARMRALVDRQRELMERQAKSVASGRVDPSNLDELGQLGYLGGR